MLDSTGVVNQFAADCVSCVLRGSKNEIIVCLATVTVAAIIRVIEKRMDKRKS